MIARIESELKDAMRARDEPRVATLRLTLSSLRSAEKELGRPLKEDEELQVLQRERKRRVESIKAFRDADREEQAEREEAELDRSRGAAPSAAFRGGARAHRGRCDRRDGGDLPP